jgi:hypothetical protein
MVSYFKELIESGEFRPLIDRRYRVAGAAPGPVVACTQPSVQPDRNT